VPAAPADPAAVLVPPLHQLLPVWAPVRFTHRSSFHEVIGSRVDDQAEDLPLPLARILPSWVEVRSTAPFLPPPPPIDSLPMIVPEAVEVGVEAEPTSEVVAEAPGQVVAADADIELELEEASPPPLLIEVFDDIERPSREEIDAALAALLLAEPSLRPPPPSPRALPDTSAPREVEPPLPPRVETAPPPPPPAAPLHRRREQAPVAPAPPQRKERCGRRTPSTWAPAPRMRTATVSSPWPA
jgi:hypothetical protein